MTSQLPRLITTEQIHDRIANLAQVIAHDFRGRPLTIVGILTGSLMFLADLVRRLDLPLRIGVIQAASYRNATSGRLTINPEMQPDLRGRHVLLLDDILDTGQTLHRLVPHVREMGAASIKIAVLLRKQGRLVHDVTVDYVGFDIPDEFVVGYGLDYNDEFRQLPYIAIMPKEMIEPAVSS